MSNINNFLLIYIEINLAMIILIGIIRFKSAGLTRMVAQRNFCCAIYAQMIFFASDTVIKMIDYGLIPFSRTLYLLDKDVYFLSMTLMCFCWFVYFEYMQDSPFVRNGRRMAASSVLVFVHAVLLLINHFNGIFFYINETDHSYVRGPLFVVQYILAYIYVLFACGRALVNSFRAKSQTERRKLRSLAMFPIAPAIAGIVQYFLPELPLACVCLAFATLLLYLSWLDEIISIDPLTRLNNRKRLDHHFNHWQQSRGDGSDLYLIIFDVDKFKGINDKYGHIQGDAALVRVADALSEGCKGFSGRTNISRYGGDEFIILASADNAEDILKLVKRIKGCLFTMNEKAGAPYDLSLSCGFAKADRNIALKELVARADVLLYEEKEIAHRA